MCSAALSEFSDDCPIQRRHTLLHQPSQIKVEHSRGGVGSGGQKYCGACGVISTSIVFLLSQGGGQKFNPAGSNRCFKSEHVGQSDDIWKEKKPK